MHSCALSLGSRKVYGIVIEAVTEAPLRVTKCATMNASVATPGTQRVPCRLGAVGSIIRLTHVQYDNIPSYVDFHLSLCEVEVYAINGKTALFSNRQSELTHRSQFIEPSVNVFGLQICGT